ncbi:Asp23/Gls24 family envelope stress response protein [Streptomyces sp. AK04-3B]|uniref:Asp23/Gls24 family envelope stress response protein n=1 Tax=unclassified Streptomyces TaxID=2593676 RepID=UPI0029AA5AB6|nr:Asp23/Gls24 family envelope stress response protein [Streptomyces sp. AK04-3B]MDX3800856.1 Asp23/Gls24 family envelope stress response protein [Streptomyces sp. AK04-3B]
MSGGSDGGDGYGARRASGVAPGGRGATRIADRVVAKIAAQAAREAVGPLPPDVGRPHATVVVRPAHPGSGGGSPVDAAHIHVHLELDYPSDLGARCRAVRRHVTERVGALAGMTVPEVAVQVERLHLAPDPGAAHGRLR